MSDLMLNIAGGSAPSFDSWRSLFSQTSKKSGPVPGSYAATEANKQKPASIRKIDGKKKFTPRKSVSTVTSEFHKQDRKRKREEDVSDQQGESGWSRKRRREDDVVDRHGEPDRRSSGTFITSLFSKNPQIPRLKQTDVEPMTESVFSKQKFEELQIDEYLVNLLQKQQHSTLTTIQQKSIPVLLEGKDALVRAQTGSGKTLAYAVPIVQALKSMEPRLTRADGVHALVIVPSRELAEQSFEWFQTLCKAFNWLVPGVLYGGEKKKTEKARLRKGITVLVATPGRLLDHINTTSCLDLSRTRWLIIDEADRLLEMGYEKDVSRILEALKKQQTNVTFRRQTVLLSATLPHSVQKLASLELHEPVNVEGEDLEEGFDLITPSNLRHCYVIVPAKLRLATLAAFVLGKAKFCGTAKILIFMPTQSAVDFFYELFAAELESRESETKIQYFKLHGKMDQAGRTLVFKNFRSVDSGILLTTDVAARGLDLPRVDWVVQWTAPLSAESYVHRVGRTARKGQQGSALLFLLPSEAGFVGKLEERRIKLTEIQMYSILDDLLLSESRHRGSSDVETVATDLQLHFERMVLQRKDLHDAAAQAYISYVRSYASYPLDLRPVLPFHQLHLGHLAKCFALRDSPKEITGIGKKSVPKGSVRTNVQMQSSGAISLRKPMMTKSKQKELMLSEFDSGLPTIKKKKKKE